MFYDLPTTQSLKAKQGDAISPEELRESEQGLFKWTEDQYDTEDKKLIQHQINKVCYVHMGDQRTSDRLV